MESNQRMSGAGCPKGLCQLLKYRDFTHPMKEDVKKKGFSPPLWEMRAW
jgi:hypothetical protein